MAALVRWALILAGVLLTPSVPGDALEDVSITNCPGYNAINVNADDSGLTADLRLAGPACNTYGYDLENLTLTMTYDTGMSTFSG